MKLGTLQQAGQLRHVVIAEWGSQPPVTLDIAKASVAMGNPWLQGLNMQGIIESGDRALDSIRQLMDWSAQHQDPSWSESVSTAKWDLPVPARSVICAGRNFGRHKQESLDYWKTQGATGIHFEFPSAFVKLAHTLVPDQARVARPEDVHAFDYEVEAVAVLGSQCHRVSEENALKHVFGYTVFNDLSAREWQLKEMRNQMIMMGKNFPGFGPIGPWLVTADEIPDPSKMRVNLRVNGRTLQDESCSDMVFSFPQLISFWSKSGLSAGDMIASGTPEGVALHRKPNAADFYLKPGDVVEATVDAIGTLTTHIV
jgi:2-keto-4-pentenoate hydratase/2-oxohepta-3-ene-1,7-dioic acid hydratase in catechol pathway